MFLKTLQILIYISNLETQFEDPKTIWIDEKKRESFSDGEKEVICEKLLELNPIQESKEFETEEDDKENTMRTSEEKKQLEKSSLRKMSEDSYFNFIM